MYKINFSYYKRGDDFERVGSPIYGAVIGASLKIVNDAYWDCHSRLDMAQYTEMTFMSVEEVEK